MIRLDIRRLSHQALREIGQQLCLVCAKHYRPPHRIYWPLPCGHGFCNLCLGGEAKSIRRQSLHEFGPYMEADNFPTLRVDFDTPQTPVKGSRTLSCPVCHSETTLVQIGL